MVSEKQKNTIGFAYLSTCANQDNNCLLGLSTVATRIVYESIKDKLPEKGNPRVMVLKHRPDLYKFTRGILMQ